MRKLFIIASWIASLFFVAWLWWRAGRSYGRNEMIDAMVLRVQPPPAPYLDVAFLFGEIPQARGLLDAGSKVHFNFSSADGWTIRNLYVNEQGKVIDGCLKEDKK